MKYIKKSVFVEAFHNVEGNEVPSWLWQHIKTPWDVGRELETIPGCFNIGTKVKPNDWVVKDGCYYDIYSDEEFKHQYLGICI